jgi:hypothetical protein
MVLSQEKFAETVINSSGEIRREIGDLKKDYSDLDKKISIHLKVEEELEDYKNELDKKKNTKFYIYMALMSIGFTVYEIGKSFFT